MSIRAAGALALALYLVGLVLAFGWRTYVQWRRTGDTGLRLDAGPVGALRWWAKVVFLAALALGLAGPLAHLLGLAPVPVLDADPVQFLGLLLAVLGVLATLAAQLELGASWRIGVDPDERTELVTTGMYAITRNPIFTAMLLSSAGLALLAPNPVTLAASTVLVLAVHLQVRGVEEPYLTRLHGPDFTAYASRVGRFLPRLTFSATRGH